MTTTEQEADELAHKVASYWLARGFAPQIWTIPELVSASPTSHRLSWTVRSDMVGGRPRPLACPVANFNPVTQRESLAGITALAGTRQPELTNKSVERSQSLWREVGAHG